MLAPWVGTGNRCGLTERECLRDEGPHGVTPPPEGP